MDATSVAAAALYMELFWYVYWLRKGREKHPETIQNSAFSSLVQFYFLLLLLLFSFFAQLLRAVSTSQRRRLFI